MSESLWAREEAALEGGERSGKFWDPLSVVTFLAHERTMGRGVFRAAPKLGTAKELWLLTDEAGRPAGQLWWAAVRESRETASEQDYPTRVGKCADFS